MFEYRQQVIESWTHIITAIHDCYGESPINWFKLLEDYSDYLDNFKSFNAIVRAIVPVAASWKLNHLYYDIPTIVANAEHSPRFPIPSDACEFAINRTLHIIYRKDGSEDFNEWCLGSLGMSTVVRMHAICGHYTDGILFFHNNAGIAPIDIYEDELRYLLATYFQQYKTRPVLYCGLNLYPLPEWWEETQSLLPADPSQKMIPIL